jgi:DNA sulfur modification protein DndC
MREAAREQGLPLEPHRLTPAAEDTFWVNCIGTGYASPREKFRWCTERLKIRPSNRFIAEVVSQYGEAILVLGTRKAESTRRAHRMTKLEARRIRERLSPNASLPNSLVYTPIEDWANDDVWIYLMQVPNPWGLSNRELLALYAGASEDGECPLVVDTTTPSCGASRFGCYVCTLVDQDRSMQAMIANDEDKEWMQPLLELRDVLAQRPDRHLRDYRRLSGAVQLHGERLIPGPYKQSVREALLRRVLETETWIRENGPAHVRHLQLISLEELIEIRRIWVIDKHEMEDSLPRIYQEVRGEPFPVSLDECLLFGAPEMALLREVCGPDEQAYERLRALLDIEWRQQASMRRAGVFEALERAYRRSFFEDEADATAYAIRRRMRLDAARTGAGEAPATIQVTELPGVS